MENRVRRISIWRKVKMNPRLSWNEYFMRMAHLAAKRSTCFRRAVGAVAVIDNHVIATGYNGVPAGLEHCTSDTCIRLQQKIPSGTRHEMCRGLHAEQNLVIQAALGTQSIKGATVYCTTFPCSICAKILINCDIKKIYYTCGYDDLLAKELFSEAGIITESLD